MQVTLPTEKHCKACDTIKPADAFSVVRRSYKAVSGKESVYICLQSGCKACINARSKRQDRTGYIRPSRLKVLNDHKEMALMQRAPSWGVQKTGYEPSKHKQYPTCEEGHKYVGKRCLLCKYGIIKQLTVYR